jgi:putative transcriptional regulator
MTNLLVGKSQQPQDAARIPTGNMAVGTKPLRLMRRVRLKADGRIVEILPDGTEQMIPKAETPAGLAVAPESGDASNDAAYARSIRARTRLTQVEFAASIGVPTETVRNWEQGKRSPRGPARALLKVIDKAPQVAFAVLGPTGQAH